MITVILIALIAIIAFAIYRNNRRIAKQPKPQASSTTALAQAVPFMTSSVDLMMADVPANTPYEIGYDQMKF